MTLSPPNGAADEGWRNVTLPELSTHFTDGPFGSNLKSDHYVETGVRVIRLQNVGVGEMLNDDAAFISRDHFESLPRNHCRPGDVIIGTLGDPSLRACIVPDDLPEALNKADCLLLRIDESIAQPPYVCHLLNSPLVLQQARTMVRGQTRGRVSLGRLKKLQIPLPPLAEQKRIAGILDAADALRVKRRESLAQLDTLLQSTFLDMFGDPVTNPMGWEARPLRDVAEFHAGATLPDGEAFCGQPGGFLSLKVSDLNDPRNTPRIERSKLWSPDQGRGSTAPADSVVIPKRGGQ